MPSPPDREPLPSPDTVVVTDAGLETWLVFDRGVDLPAFAAYRLVATPEGRALLTEYYGHYLAIAEHVGAAVALDAPTWRASPDWGETLGHDRATLAGLIDASVDVVEALRDRWAGPQPFLIGGSIGPRGDAYRVGTAMSAGAAADYHAFQVGCLAHTPVAMISAMTLTYAEEAIGIAHAAADADVPVVISFTVETDGRLPSGMPLGDAIEATDAATGSYPAWYMVNCAHPTHFDHVLDGGAPWLARLRGLRANASTASHAELDEMEELDAGDPDDLAARYVALRDVLPALHVIGGCCGTDDRHVRRIATAFVAAAGR